MNIEPRYLDGVRITDTPSLAIVEMVLCGAVNKRLVRYLVNGGVHALGLSGVDMGIVRAEKMPHPSEDMGYTGVVTSVKGDTLLSLLNQGITPVLAPICLGTDSSFNVNADHVAGAVAAAIKADRVVFLTNVRGVLVENRVVPMMTAPEAEKLIADGIIFGGMIPKVRAALQALDSGVPQAVITNLAGLKAHGGTAFIRAGDAGPMLGKTLNEQQFALMTQWMKDYEANVIDLGTLVVRLEAAISKLDMPDNRRNAFLCHWNILGDVHTYAVDEGMKPLSPPYQRLVNVCIVGLRELVQLETP